MRARPIGWFLASARPDRGPWLGAGACWSVLVLCQILTPVALGRLVEALAAGDPVTGPALFVVGLQLGALVADAAVNLGLVVLAGRLVDRQRVAAARHAFQLGLSFYANTTPGEITGRVMSELSAVENLIVKIAPKLASTVALALGAFVVMVFLSWPLGLLLLAQFLLVGLWLWRRQPVHQSLQELRTAQLSEAAGLAEESIAAREELRGNRGQSLALGRFANVQHDLYDSFVGTDRTKARDMSFINAVAWVVLVSGIGWCIWSQHSGALNVGITVAFVTYGTQLRNRLTWITGNLVQAQEATAALARFRRLLAEPLAVPDIGTDRTLETSAAPELAFDDVTFSYGDDAVLSNVTFRLRAGRMLGVVGRTGAGKTTLVRLMQRLADPTSGVIRLDGVDLRDIPLELLYRRIAVVTQQVHIFSATLRDNLRLFDETLNDERVLDSLHRIGLDDWFAELPNGLDTMLGDGGDIGLSGGQAQLIAVARAIVSDPALVILDEATSRLDERTEGRLADAMERLSAGRTSIVIAHRLATLRRADDILVLAGGRVEEFGAYDALVDAGGMFSDLLAHEEALRR